MVGKYHYHILQTKPPHREEEPQNSNSHKTSGKQLKQSNQLSLPHQNGCKTSKDTKHCTTKHGRNTEPPKWQQQ